MYLAVFEHRYSLGSEQQSSWKCQADVYACADVKQRWGAKRKGVSREKENQILAENHTERETLSCADAVPRPVLSCALRGAKE